MFFPDLAVALDGSASNGRPTCWCRKREWFWYIKEWRCTPQKNETCVVQRLLQTCAIT